MPVRVITVSDAVAVAQRWFLESREVDMQALADELAVGRATLYRVVGSRDRLLGDVLYALSLDALRDSLAQARDRGFAPGVDRIVEAARIMNRTVMEYGPVLDFVAREPEAAFRVMFMPAAQVHTRLVHEWTTVLAKAVANGHLDQDLDTARIGYMFVRIGESAIYADLLAGREPDLELAAALQRQLLTMGAS